jgi:hypothetical protein
MAKKDDVAAHGSALAGPGPGAVDESAAPPSTTAETAAPPTAPTALIDVPPDAPATALPTPLVTAREFDITLKNNDNPDQTRVVVARGVDGGLAAQAAMRERPGWTADHSQTHEHSEPLHDTHHSER